MNKPISFVLGVLSEPFPEQVFELLRDKYKIAHSLDILKLMEDYANEKGFASWQPFIDKKRAANKKSLDNLFNLLNRG